MHCRVFVDRDVDGDGAVRYDCATMDKADLILRLLEEFRDEANRRFDQAAKLSEDFRGETLRRFEQIDKRFEHLDKRLDRLEEDSRGNRLKLDEVYEARNRVKITFGWQWIMASFVLAAFAAGLARLLV